MGLTYSSQRHDGDEAEGETEGSIPVEGMGDDAEGDEDEEDVEVGAKEEVLV